MLPTIPACTSSQGDGRVDLRSLDDGYETERTVANTRALIAQEQVFALLGFYGSSPTTAAMNEVFGVAKVPLVGTISGADSRASPALRRRMT